MIIAAAPAPAACDRSQADTDAYGPRNTNGNGSRKFSRSCKTPVWQLWDYRMLFFQFIVKMVKGLGHAILGNFV